MACACVPFACVPDDACVHPMLRLAKMSIPITAHPRIAILKFGPRCRAGGWVCSEYFLSINLTVVIIRVI